MRVVLASLLAILLLVPLTTAGPAAPAIERVYDAQGRLVEERGPVPGHEDMRFERHYFLASSDGLEANDCTSTSYRAAAWRWNGPYHVHTTAYAGEVAASLAAWDAQTGAALVGSVAQGRAGTAGSFDGVNQIDWAPLSSTSTIAVTTTWYYRSNHVAVESDGQYNTRFAWATDGSAGAMDVQNIATHEIGHTFGLDHPKGKGVGCLSMYAYASYGETQKRTLGEGDIRGIRAIYGA